MLIILDGILVDIGTPAPVEPRYYRIEKIGNRLVLLADEKLIESGVRWYCYTGDVKIDGRSGEISAKRAKDAKFRAVFGSKMAELTLSVSP